MELVKQWVGISDGTGAGAGTGGSAPGIAQLAGMFGLGQDSASTKRSTSNKRTTRSTSSKNKRGKAAPADGAGIGLGDFADILKSATGTGAGTGSAAAAGAGGGEWQDVVQGYVKNALVKASGLEWLFGQTAEVPEQKKRTR
jgi:hypothetical protein